MDNESQNENKGASVEKDLSFQNTINKLTEGSWFHIKGTEKECQCTVNGITLDQLLELRNYSRLFSQSLGKGQSIGNQNSASLKQGYKAFASIIDKIESLYLTIAAGQTQGCLGNSGVTINVNSPIASSDGLSFDELIALCKQNLEDYRKEQEKGFSEGEYVNLLHENQLIMLYQYIENSKKKNYIKHLTSYLTNNQCEALPYYYYLQKFKEPYKDMIYHIESYIGELFKENDISLSSIYQSNVIKSKKQYQGIYLLQGSMNDNEATVINWYLTLTGNGPLAYTVLSSCEYAGIDEITSFLYRAIRSKDNVLFFFILPDTLNLNKRTEIAALIRKLALNSLQMKSSLFILYSKQTCEVIEYLGKLPGVCSALNIKMLKEEPKNIEVIYSDASGVGKSKQIETEIKQSGKHYVYFPLGGEFTQERLAKRLSQLELQSTSVIHLDLMDTQQLSLKHFLFSFLFLKSYSSFNDLFFLPKDIEIKVEIPFGFINYMEKFPILKVFKRRLVSIKSMMPLIVPSDPLSNLQIVCNYLNNYNTISSKEIFISSLKKSPSQESITVTALHEDTCRQLIKQYFPFPNATYYQITSFIEILASQLTCLSYSIFLKVSLLKDWGREKKAPNLHHVRALVLKSMIELAISLTKGAFDHIIEQQHDTFILQQSNSYDEGKAQEEALRALSKRKPVSYERLEPGLVFFNEDGQSISIISTAKRDSDEYLRLKELLNCSTLPGKEHDLTDYKYMCYNNDWLYGVKRVLNLRNPASDYDVIKEKERNLKCSFKSIESIVRPFYFFYDNFIRMVLIVLRMRAKVPVILMGGIGESKVCLIQILAELLNKKLMVLNLQEEDLRDEDIISFMRKVNGSLNENPKLGFWVLLEEINTCHSMGLITEMMCKRTMEGEPISDRILFFATSKPYHPYPKKETDINFVKEEKTAGEHLERSKVYLLPHSLLNYVFDFGPELYRKDGGEASKTEIN